MSGERADQARRLIGLVDLTDLSDGCTSEAVAELCRRAVGPHGFVAAVCVWPQFVAQARAVLAGSGVRVATVVNFPSGREEVMPTVAAAEQALTDGADEIDLVLPYHALQINDIEKAGAMVLGVGEVVRRNDGLMKVILETGELADDGMIRTAAQLAIANGADFIKTSTGKTPVSATPRAAWIMLEAIHDSGRTVGIKPSGGIRTIDDAQRYVSVAEAVMGTGWVGRWTFRLGASGLLDALEAEITGVAPGSADDQAY